MSASATPTKRQIYCRDTRPRANCKRGELNRRQSATENGAALAVVEQRAFCRLFRGIVVILLMAEIRGAARRQMRGFPSCLSPLIIPCPLSLAAKAVFFERARLLEGYKYGPFIIRSLYREYLSVII